MRFPSFSRGTLCLGAVFLASAYLLLTGVLNFVDGTVLVSPDETANRVFALWFLDHGTLRIPEMLNRLAGETLFPRSVVAYAGELIPAGFLGIPVLVGSVGVILGAWSVVWVVPLLACLALLAWWDTWRVWQGERFAAAVLLLTATLPAYWYYSARVLMPNVPFVACLMVAIWFAVRRPLQTRVSHVPIDLVLAGGSLGMAFFIRPIEGFWLILLLGLFVLVFWKQRGTTWKTNGLAFLLGSGVMVAVTLLFHQLTYGHFFATGYTFFRSVQQVVQTEVTEIVATPNLLTSLFSSLFPFGFHPRVAAEHAELFFVHLSFELLLFACIGAGFAVTVSRFWRAYLGLSLVMAGWLILMYGSWTIRDNPDPSVVSLANSYVRYWLPISVAMVPIVVLGVQRLMRLLPSYQTVVASLIVLSFAVCGVLRTWMIGPESLMRVAQTLERTERCKAVFLAPLSEPSIVVADRADKLFFGAGHAVRQPLRDETTYRWLDEYVALRPTWYVGITLPEIDLSYLNQDKLRAQQLRFVPVVSCAEETLYRIESTAL